MKKPFSLDRLLLPTIIAILIAGLIALGLLQYRWATQIGEVAGLRLTTTVNTMMTNWHLDLFHQLSDVCIGLQVGPDSGAHDGWQVYLERYERWTQKAVDPALVHDVFIWETSTPGTPRLLRFNLRRGRLETVSASPVLRPLLDRLTTTSGSLPAALHAWKENDRSESQPEAAPLPTHGGDVGTGWQFDPNIPAVVHPIIHHPLPGNIRQPRNSQAVDWIVIVYDWEKIQSDLIPRLAQRYFGNPEGLEFKVAVVVATGAKPSRTIYSSDPDFGSTLSGDAMMNIFGPVPQSVEAQVWQPVRTRGSAPDEAHVSGLLWFRVMQYAGPKTTWELLLKHRSDSLEGIVAGVRRRNFLVGLGVLAVLAAGMGMVLWASYRAQMLSKLQMQFVASVSHELRTPITVLSSATENISDGLVQDKQRLHQYRSMMTRQIRNLSQLVEQVLLFAASREARSRPAIRRVQVKSVVDSALDQTQAFIEQNGFRLEQLVDDKLPDVSADPAALSQCLQSIIVNAVKYGGESRWLCIEARANGRPGRHSEVQITVRDRGLGIKGDELGHVFEPFYRSPSVSATDIHGTGLGLSLTKSMIESMGGRISVWSEFGVGSAFTLHVPAWQSENTRDHDLVSDVIKS